MCHYPSFSCLLWSLLCWAKCNTLIVKKLSLKYQISNNFDCGLIAPGNSWQNILIPLLKNDSKRIFKPGGWVRTICRGIAWCVVAWRGRLCRVIGSSLFLDFGWQGRRLPGSGRGGWFGLVVVGWRGWWWGWGCLSAIFGLLVPWIGLFRRRSGRGASHKVLPCRRAGFWQPGRCQREVLSAGW